VSSEAERRVGFLFGLLGLLVIWCWWRRATAGAPQRHFQLEDRLRSGCVASVRQRRRPTTHSDPTHTREGWQGRTLRSLYVTYSMLDAPHMPTRPPQPRVIPLASAEANGVLRGVNIHEERVRTSTLP
jgi:hypothetical protein